MQYAGRDATAAYEPIHPPDALEKNLAPEKHLGSLTHDAQSTIAEQNKNKKKTLDEERVEKAQSEKPSINRILSLRDIEKVARNVLSHKALAYYSSASDDEISTSGILCLVRHWLTGSTHPQLISRTKELSPGSFSTLVSCALSHNAIRPPLFLVSLHLFPSLSVAQLLRSSDIR